MLGYFLHLNPYGSFHLDLDALLLGVACCAPVIALGAQQLPLVAHYSISTGASVCQSRHVLSVDVCFPDGQMRPWGCLTIRAGKA